MQPFQVTEDNKIRITNPISLSSNEIAAITKFNSLDTISRSINLYPFTTTLTKKDSR